MIENLGFNKKLLIEIDGVQATNGKIPILNDLELDNDSTLLNVKVDNSDPIKVNLKLKTYHVSDSNLITAECNKVSETLFKTWSISEINQLKEIQIILNREDINLYLYIDEEKHVDLDINKFYEYTCGNNNSKSSHKMVEVIKINGNFYIKLVFADTPVTTNIKLKLKYNGRNDSKIITKYFDIITYNKE